MVINDVTQNDDKKKSKGIKCRQSKNTSTRWWLFVFDLHFDYLDSIYGCSFSASVQADIILAVYSLSTSHHPRVRQNVVATEYGSVLCIIEKNDR
jgi:hypothetical protein